MKAALLSLALIAAKSFDSSGASHGEIVDLPPRGTEALIAEGLGGVR